MSNDVRMRCLFCYGVLPAFFEASTAVRKEIFEALKSGFDDLGGRFGVTVLGAMDDDKLMVGPSFTYPWTSYILADVPNYDTIVRISSLMREIMIGGEPLYRYMKVEARPGRELFFGSR